MQKGITENAQVVGVSQESLGYNGMGNNSKSAVTYQTS